jgi:transcriptional regulator with GAF, ATPase, and Fis domain
MKHDLTAVLDRLEAGVLITDKQGRVLFANSTFRKLSGCPVGGGLGKSRIQELQALLERISAPSQPATGLTQLRDQERAHILAVLNQTNGKIYGSDGAAALLGLPPTTLVSRLRKYGLPPKRKRAVPPASLIPPPPDEEPEMLD